MQRLVENLYATAVTAKLAERSAQVRNIHRRVNPVRPVSFLNLVDSGRLIERARASNIRGLR